MIKGSVFLVTGGAAGYGRAVVEKLLIEGAKVGICDLPTRNLKIFGDDKVIFLPININSENDVQTVMAIIKEKFGKLDGLINCIDHFKSLPVYDFKNKQAHCLDEFIKIVFENILGPFNIIRFAVHLISRNERNKNGHKGIIINMSNMAAVDGAKENCAYSASKAAVVGMTTSLAQELEAIHIRVLSILTGHSAHRNNTENETHSSQTDEHKCFADLVKTVIETPMLNSSFIKLNSIEIHNIT